MDSNVKHEWKSEWKLLGHAHNARVGECRHAFQKNAKHL